MIIKDLEIENFRNYRYLKIEFDSHTNILYGRNAQGKTNILEAVYLCGTTKSHRTNKDSEMIRMGEEEGHVKLILDKEEKNYRIDVHLKKNQHKGIAINKIPIKKASELFGILNVVSFSPEDLNIIKEGPAVRRKFIDVELCQLDKIYLYNLTNYNRALRQRNAALKEISYESGKRDELDIWDLQLSNYGKEIIKRRENFIKEIKEIVKPVHKKISGEEIEIEYEKNSEGEEIYEKLLMNRDEDIRKKYTSAGPHRDDLIFKVNGKNVRVYGSQGQKRTAALALKLSEIEIVKKKTGESPVLLLDDVLSELDSERQNFLLQSLGGLQTIITCTGVDDFIENNFNIDKIFNVSEGTVTEGVVKEVSGKEQI